MDISKQIFTGFLIGAVLSVPIFVPASDSQTKATAHPTLGIAHDPATGKIIVNWTGKGILKQSPELHGHFKAVNNSSGTAGVFATDPTEGQQLFRLESAYGGIFSVNAIGYVKLSIGADSLALIANPLDQPNNDLNIILPLKDDGSQDGVTIYRFNPATGTYCNAITWMSNAPGTGGLWCSADSAADPNATVVNPGEGFFICNNTGAAVDLVFVGEVLQGALTNNLPAGMSMKGSLVPQSGSINSTLQIPGQPGDEIWIYANDQQGGGSYSVSIFDSQQNAWVPDLVLQVAQGFLIRKQNAEDWVRIFSVN